jgi:hypothetical protein
MLCDVLVIFPIVKVLFVLKFGWPPSLSIVMYFFVMMVKIYFYENLSFQHFGWCPPSSICYSTIFLTLKIFYFYF